MQQFFEKTLPPSAVIKPRAFSAISKFRRWGTTDGPPRLLDDAFYEPGGLLSEFVGASYHLTSYDIQHYIIQQVHLDLELTKESQLDTFAV